MLPSLGIDMTDLVRGDGEWKNMQDVVRHAFRLSFETLEKQKLEQSSLASILHSVRESSTHKLTENEVIAILEARERTDQNLARKDDLEVLQAKVAEVRSDLARKATTKYVDDSMRRKLDKSDMILRNAPPAAGTSAEVARLAQENRELRLRMESMESSMREMTEMMKMFAPMGELKAVQSQVDQLHGVVRQCPSKTDIHVLLDRKIDQSDLDSQLSSKADKTSVSNAILKVERVAGEHEKMLTQMRLRGGGQGQGQGIGVRFRSGNEANSVYDEDDIPFSPLHSPRYLSSSTGGGGLESPQPWGKSTKRTQSPKRGGLARSSASATSGTTEGMLIDADDDETLDARLKTQQTEAVLTTMWSKINKLGRDVTSVRNDIGTNASRLQVVEGHLDTLVTKDHLDERILTEHEDVLNERKMLAGRMDEVFTFLQLPQKRTLAVHLDQVGSCIDSLSSRIAESNTHIADLTARTEEHESHSHLLDARLVMVEENNEHLIRLDKHCDLGTSGFGSIADIAHCSNNLLSKITDLDSREKMNESLFRNFEARIADQKTQIDHNDHSTKYLYTRVEASEQGVQQIRSRVDDVETIMSGYGRLGYRSSPPKGTQQQVSSPSGSHQGHYGHHGHHGHGHHSSLPLPRAPLRADSSAPQPGFPKVNVPTIVPLAVQSDGGNSNSGVPETNIQDETLISTSSIPSSSRNVSFVGREDEVSSTNISVIEANTSTSSAISKTSQSQKDKDASSVVEKRAVAQVDARLEELRKEKDRLRSKLEASLPK